MIRCIRIQGFAYVALLMLLVFLSCLDTIDLEAPAGVDGALVIQGELIKGDPSVVNVEVSRLFDFSATSRFRVSAKSVFIFDAKGNSVKLDELLAGEYVASIPVSDPLKIEVGGEYFIRVEARDGRIYESVPETMLLGDDIRDMRYSVADVEVTDEFGTITVKQKIQVFLSTTTLDPQTGVPTRLKWDVRRNYRITDTPINPEETDPKTCYIDDNPQGDEILIVDGNTMTTSTLDSFQVFDGIVNSFYGEGAYLNVFQQAVSEGTYQYWDEIRELISRSGGMFEPVAGEIVSNIFNVENSDDVVYGYFSCYLQDTSRIYIDPETVGNPRKECPPLSGIVNLNGDCNVRKCCDCLDAPNSTTEQPEYWTE